MKETIRVNGETGHADVIRSLRSIGDHKSFFRDLYKINSKLNKSNVKISFDKTGQPVLNGEVPFQSEQLRADLRLQPESVVFADVPNAPPATASSTGTNSNFEANGTNAPFVTTAVDGSEWNANRLNDGLRAQMFVQNILAFAWRYYKRNCELISDVLSIQFDEDFVTNVCTALTVLARQMGSELGPFLLRTAENVLFDRLNQIYRSRWLRLAVGSVRDVYEHLLSTLRDIWQFIQNGATFRETIERLLEDMSQAVVERLLSITKMSFGSIVALGLNEFPSFDAYFGDVLDMINRMAYDNDVADVSLYVLLMDTPAIAILHERTVNYYERMSKRSELAVRCSKCDGYYSEVIHKM